MLRAIINFGQFCDRAARYDDRTFAAWSVIKALRD